MAARRDLRRGRPRPVLQAVPEPPRDGRYSSGRRRRGRQAQEVERLLGLGARRPRIGQAMSCWVVLADPEGNALLRHARTWTAYATADRSRLSRSTAADPDRVTRRASGPGCTGSDRCRTASHRRSRAPTVAAGHPCSSCAQPAPKRVAELRLHLDVRLEPEIDDVAAGMRRAWRPSSSPSTGRRPAVAALRRPVGDELRDWSPRLARATVVRAQSTYADIQRSISAYAAARGSGSDSTTSWRAPSIAM